MPSKRTADSVQKGPAIKRKREQSINAAYQHADADVVLVSSDDVEFRVHSWHLKAASSVFVDLLSMPSNSRGSSRAFEGLKRLELTDPTLENSLMIRIFLDVIYVRPPYKSWSTHLEDYIRLFRVFDKYGCEKTRRSFHHMIASEIYNKIEWVDDAFILAACLDDIALAAHCIRKGSQSSWKTKEEAAFDPNQGVKDVDVLDLRAMPFDTYAQIPPKYAHALLRATLHAKEDRTYWEQVAKNFKKIMEYQLRNQSNPA